MWSESCQSLYDNLLNDSIPTRLRLQHKEITEVMSKGVGKRPAQSGKKSRSRVAFGNYRNVHSRIQDPMCKNFRSFRGEIIFYPHYGLFKFMKILRSFDISHREATKFLTVSTCSISCQIETYLHGLFRMIGGCLIIVLPIPF